MSTDAFLSMFGVREAHDPIDPMKAAQSARRGALPRRFYREAQAEWRCGHWHLLLDGKAAKTPKRIALAVTNRAVAEALAAEWNAQADVLDPLHMPLTRLVNAALDGVADEAEAVRADIVRYAGTDLICYRAASPIELAERQARIWDPILGWAKATLGVRLKTAAGIVHVTQADGELSRVAAAVATVPSPVPLAALSTVTTLGGSAMIALALAHRALAPDEAWAATHVDEHYQAEVWGADHEALQRQQHRRREFDAAALALASWQTASAQE